MRQVSADYNPFPRVREVDCRISFGVMDQNAKNAEVSGNDTGFIARYDQTTDGVVEIAGKWASLERNFWSLDGTYDIAPDNVALVQTGWWSSLISGDDGTFATAPVIRYDFGAAITTLGWTLRFDDKSGQFPVSVRVDTFASDGSALESLTFTPDSAVQVYRHYAADYYGVQFTFLQTNEPYRRIRLVECDFGITQHYDRNSIGTAELIYGVTLDGSALPSRELVFTFDNADKTYNLLNPDGVYQYLQDGQIITAQLVIGGETVDMGSFYFTSADASKSAILPTITAHDRVYALDGRNFDGGRDEETTLELAVAEVLADYNIPLAFGDGVGSRSVHMSIPLNTKVREVVRMLAQAARCSVYIDRDGVMRFVDLSLMADPDGYITADELYDYSGVGISPKVDGVRLTVKDDFRAGKDGTPGRQVTYHTGSGEQIKGYANPCVADSEGQAVCDWLYAVCNMRKKYDVKNRCDPAVEIGDTLNIADAYGNRENAIVTGIDITFGHSLSAQTEATGQ